MNPANFVQLLFIFSGYVLPLSPVSMELVGTAEVVLSTSVMIESVGDVTINFEKVLELDGNDMFSVVILVVLVVSS